MARQNQNNGQDHVDLSIARVLWDLEMIDWDFEVIKSAGSYVSFLRAKRYLQSGSARI